ncbi:MAG: DEAD/DEAH box helicase, partial [Myxococcota bacterium]|nr:DEAD/DEAH box helicase [Myxococcota bacterium]
MTFDNINIRPELRSRINELGYTKATPIQEKAIPLILEGKDVLGGAQTGTGKTAAFVLPLLDKLSRNRSFFLDPRALIMAPTRELAAQVEESVRSYGQNLNLRSTVIYGGVGINPQIERIEGGLDIIVGTPGRLLDLLNRKCLDLSRIEVLV